MAIPSINEIFGANMLCFYGQTALQNKRLELAVELFERVEAVANRKIMDLESQNADLLESQFESDWNAKESILADIRLQEEYKLEAFFGIGACKEAFRAFQAKMKE